MTTQTENEKKIYSVSVNVIFRAEYLIEDIEVVANEDDIDEEVSNYIEGLDWYELENLISINGAIQFGDVEQVSAEEYEEV